MRIVGLGGSLSKNSTSLSALRIALRGAEEAGAEVRLYDIREMNLPFYSSDIDSAAADEFAETVFSAQGMIWSSPMYHGTISGSFKNALDWLHLLTKRDPPLLADKIIGLISTAGGMQGLQAVNTMEFAVRALRAWAVPFVLPIAQAWKAFDEQGRPNDTKVEEQLLMLGREVIRATRQFADQGYCDYSLPPTLKKST